MAKVRFQMFLDSEQKDLLQQVQKEARMPTAEIIRRAIDQFLALRKNGDNISTGDPLTKELLAVVGVCKDGPRDMADHHDLYLYGMARK